MYLTRLIHLPTTEPAMIAVLLAVTNVGDAVGIEGFCIDKECE